MRLNSKTAKILRREARRLEAEVRGHLKSNAPVTHFAPREYKRETRKEPLFERGTRRQIVVDAIKTLGMPIKLAEATAAWFYHALKKTHRRAA